MDGWMDGSMGERAAGKARDLAGAGNTQNQRGLKKCHFSRVTLSGKANSGKRECGNETDAVLQGAKEKKVGKRMGANE
jgi:hypothetical protein